MSDKAKQGTFCWNELATNNVQAAKDFYGKVFGWKFSEIETGECEYTMFKLDDKDFGGIWAIPKDKEKEIPPHWLSYIYVENVEESLEKALKHGATVIKPVTSAGECGYFSIIKDPTGAFIALWQPVQECVK